MQNAKLVQHHTSVLARSVVILHSLLQNQNFKPMADIIEISREALHDRVADRLRAMLIEGQIAPGTKLNERILCEQLAVSRTPLREAIKLLGSEGMLDLIPNRGAVAVKLSEADVISTFEVLSGLEGLSGQFAARRITDEEIREVKGLHYEMLAAYARKDLPNYYRLNAAIHVAINRAAKNPVLESTYNRINARVQSLRFSTNLHEVKWASAVKEHEQIIEALAARDEAAVSRLLMDHVNAKLEAILEVMRKRASKA